MKNENTRTLVFGAMMVAMTAILMLTCRYVPMLSIFGAFVCGIPMAVFAAKSGFKLLIPATIAVFAVLVFIDGNFVSAASTLLMSVVPGVVAGYTLGRKKPFFIILFATCVAVCIGWLFELLVLKVLIGSGIDEIIKETLSQMKIYMDSMLNSLNGSEISALKVPPEKFISLALETVEFTIRLYFPSLVIVSSMVTGYIIIRISGFVINRAQIANVKSVPFSFLRVPRSMSVVAIICYIIYIFLDQKSTTWPIFANLVMILYVIIGICGLSVIDFKLKKKITSGLLRFIIYAVIFLFASALMGIILSILVLVGIMDVNRDFRHIETTGE